MCVKQNGNKRDIGLLKKGNQHQRDMYLTYYYAWLPKILLKKNFKQYGKKIEKEILDKVVLKTIYHIVDFEILQKDNKKIKTNDDIDRFMIVKAVGLIKREYKPRSKRENWFKRNIILIDEKIQDVFSKYNLTEIKNDHGLGYLFEPNSSKFIRYIEKNLKPYEVDIIIHKYVNDWTYKEISEQYGKSINSIKQDILRIKKKIRKKYNSENG